MAKTTDYMREAASDAADTADEFIDTIIEALCESGKASDDLLNDYPSGDSYHHERHVDRPYSLLEAANLLEDLDDYEETDNGLWDGQAPREAISIQAAFTYGNAVYSMFRDIIESINDDSDIEALVEEYAAAGSADGPIDPAAMDADECQDWLSDQGIDTDAIDLPADAVECWRERVRAELSTTEPIRSTDAIKADIKSEVEKIIKNSR